MDLVEPLKELEKLKQRNAMLESDNRLLNNLNETLRKNLKIITELYEKEKKTSALALDKLYTLEKYERRK